MVKVEVLPDPGSAAERAAELVADAARAVSEGGRFAWAISGGDGPAPMFRRLGDLDLPWDRIDTWQVDERVAPPGDPDRNRSQQAAALPSEAVEGIRWMPVEEEEDLDAAAARYASSLPERFDIVHLGLGPDGHTASLVPGDPVLDVHDRDVAVTGPYEGRRRMTLTYPALSRARRAIWLVTGSGKRRALHQLIAGDRSIPGARISVVDQLVVTDLALDAAREEP